MPRKRPQSYIFKMGKWHDQFTEKERQLPLNIKNFSTLIIREVQIKLHPSDWQKPQCESIPGGQGSGGRALISSDGGNAKQSSRRGTWPVPSSTLPHNPTFRNPSQRLAGKHKKFATVSSPPTSLPDLRPHLTRCHPEPGARCWGGQRPAVLT